MKTATFLSTKEKRQGQFQSLRDLSPEEAQQRFAQWRTSEEQNVNAILTGDQQKRYRQLQQQGIAALADKPVADELKLTAEQRGKVQRNDAPMVRAVPHEFLTTGGYTINVRGMSSLGRGQ